MFGFATVFVCLLLCWICLMHRNLLSISKSSSKEDALSLCIMRTHKDVNYLRRCLFTAMKHPWYWAMPKLKIWRIHFSVVYLFSFIHKEYCFCLNFLISGHIWLMWLWIFNLHSISVPDSLLQLLGNHKQISRFYCSWVGNLVYWESA